MGQVKKHRQQRLTLKVSITVFAFYGLNTASNFPKLKLDAMEGFHKKGLDFDL